MTALGKILAFFVLLFSLVTGGMIVVVYLTTTNWKKAHEKLFAEHNAAVAAMKAEQEKAKRDRDGLEAVIQRMQAQVEADKKEVLGLQTQIKDKDKQIADQEAKAKVETTNSETATNEITKLKNERDQMNGIITDRNTRILTLEKDIVDFRNRAVQAEINYKEALRKIENLQLAIEDKNKQLDDYKSRGIQLSKANQPQTPEVEVKGQVVEVEPTGRFAEISLGRNHELKEGDVLQVYRLTPAPVYLGTLKIQRADVNKSAGLFTPANRNARIMKGDTVDTEVLGRN